LGFRCESRGSFIITRSARHACRSLRSRRGKLSLDYRPDHRLEWTRTISKLNRTVLFLDHRLAIWNPPGCRCPTILPL
jgi:hypothetical protein